MHGPDLATDEQAIRAREPTPHGCHQRRVEQQVHRDPYGCARRCDDVTAASSRCMSAFPGIDRDVEVTRRVRDLGEQCEISRTRCIGLREQRVRLVPLPCRCCDPRSLDQTRHANPL